MAILFTVCGRAGSKGFQSKNLKDFLSVPLVYYTLAAIRLWQQRAGFVIAGRGSGLYPQSDCLTKP